MADDATRISEWVGEHLPGEWELTDWQWSILDDLPTKTFHISGFWQPEVITLTARKVIKLGRDAYAIDLTSASYRRLTGRQHPRIGRMHSAYRARRGRQW